MLLGNHSVLQKSPNRFLAGSTTSVEGQVRSNFSKSGNNRNRFYIDQAATALKTYAIPQGNYPSRAWLLPQKAGELSSHNDAYLVVSNVTGIAVGGITTTGSAAFSITTNTPDGQLISSGNGSASFSLTTNTPLLTASIGGTGATNFTVSGNPSLLGAVASGGGSATFSVTSSATILPSNDAPPARTAAASFTITGNLTPYAIGNMVGASLPYTVLSPASLAAAVWQSNKTDFNDVGTMGNALNNAASGGVDYSALASAVWANATRTLTGGAAPTEAQIAAAIRAELTVELARITKLAALSAIDATLVVTPTTRTAGVVTQTISTVGDTTTVS